MSYNELHINVTQLDSIRFWDFREMDHPYHIQTEDVLGWFGLWTKMKKGLYDSYLSFRTGQSSYRLSPATTETEIKEFLDERNESWEIHNHIIYKDGMFQYYPKVSFQLISGKYGTIGFKTVKEAKDFIDELTSLNPNLRLIDEQ